MTGRFRILGIGDLIFDHVFVHRNRGLVYSHGSGGGSVFNILANLGVNAARGDKMFAMGVGGADVFGTAAVQELEVTGVDTTRIVLIPKQTTQIVFETLEGRAPQDDDRHSFALTCPICGEKPRPHTWASIWKRQNSLVPFEDLDVVCVDRISPSRIEICRSLRNQGVITVLDLGRLGFIRYRPISQLINALSVFNIVLLPLKVAEALVRRVGLATMAELLGLGLDVVLVSMGPNGLRVFGREEGATREEYLEAPVCEAVVDESGAGDALLAYFVRELWQIFGRDAPAARWPDVVEAAARCVEAVKPVLGALGARGHLRPIGERRHQIATDHWAGLGIGEIREGINLTDYPCPFCCVKRRVEQTPRTRPSPSYGARKNVEVMGKRILFALEHRDALAACEELLSEGGTSYAIGTGGSYAVAEFWALALEQHSKTFCKAIRPLEYVRKGTQSDTVIVLSYSGGTADCEAAIFRAKDLGVRRICLVTGSPKPALAALLRPRTDFVIGYGRHRGQGRFGKERGFVSIAGMVSPCALIAASVVGQVRIASLADKLGALERARSDESSDLGTGGLIAAARRFAGATKTAPFVSVFGGGWAWPAVIDFESKSVEAGLTVAQVHEVKDFSHGRFISLLANTAIPALFMGVPAVLPYERALLHSLRKGRIVIEVVPEGEGIVGGLELLAMMQYVIEICGEECGRDISRPDKIPESGLRLYRWRDEAVGARLRAERGLLFDTE